MADAKLEDGYALKMPVMNAKLEARPMAVLLTGGWGAAVVARGATASHLEGDAVSFVLEADLDTFVLAALAY